MANKADYLKIIVEDMLKQSTVKYTDTTEEIKIKAPVVQWQFVAGKAIHITKIESRDDRILIHYPLRMPPAIINALKKLSPNELNPLVIEINEITLTAGLAVQWSINKDNVPDGVDIKGYVDVDELTRPNLFRIWDMCANIAGLAQQKITLKANPGQTVSGIETSDVYDKQMYG